MKKKGCKWLYTTHDEAEYDAAVSIYRWRESILSLHVICRDDVIKRKYMHCEIKEYWWMDLFCPSEAITHQFISITAVTTNFIFLINIYVSIFKDNPWFEKIIIDSSNSIIIIWYFAIFTTILFIPFPVCRTSVLEWRFSIQVWALCFTCSVQVSK